MTPELKILTINATIMAVAYLGIYPSRHITRISQMMPTDLGLTALSLLAAGGLFAGSGIRFNLILTETNWAIFAIATLALIEFPLMIWFCRRNGIEIGGDDTKGDGP
ncbi:hypothetical protein FQV27_06930 [Paracoccus aurantiacus]|uniref:Uncharacterized protein n=1 Tax=Paracoccus aurantiacus TaxID=2599412 RepID=A0A5C6S7X2_9RHOB|nr:hypothetical protein [Paracoccus aurantiacus]TXB69842.1 hypothetical protein FQV27_06930 [Paracoccus aurantiacus]